MTTVDDAIEAGARARVDFMTTGKNRVPVTDDVWRAVFRTRVEIGASRAVVAAAWPILSAPLREEHRPYGLYELEDSCPDGSDEHREEHHHQCSDDIGEFYCDQLRIGTLCSECRDEDGERVEYPCPTMARILQTDKELGL